MGSIARMAAQFVSTAIVLLLILFALFMFAGGEVPMAIVMLVLAVGVFFGRRLLFSLAEGRLWKKEVAP